MASGRPSRWRHSSTSSPSPSTGGEHRLHGPRPLDEQLRRLVVAERTDDDLALALDAERLAAGRDDAQARAAGEQHERARRRRRRDVLAVVEHDHRVAVAEALDGPLLGRRRRVARRPALAPARRSPEATASATATGWRHGRQLDEPHLAAVGEAADQLERQSGLADAAGPDDRRQPGRGDGVGRARPARRRRPTNDVSGDRHARGRPATIGVEGDRRGERRIVGEHRPLEALQLGPGIEAELVEQVLAGVPVGLQRVGLPTGPVEGDDQLGPEPLAQRVAGRRGRRAWASTSAWRPIVSSPSTSPSWAASTSSSQAGDGVTGEPGVGELGRAAAPDELDGGPERVDGDAVVARADASRASWTSRSRRTASIRSGRAAATYPGALAGDDVATEQPAQVGHQRLQGVGRVAGLLVAPQLLDQPVVGDRRGARPGPAGRAATAA